MTAYAHLEPLPVRVLIADDQRLFWDALDAILGADDRIEVVDYARNGEEAARKAIELRPDVTLMDISMPRLDGVEATRRIRAALPRACVVMLTGSDATEDVARAREAGAAAYVTKDRIAADLVGTILEIAAR